MQKYWTLLLVASMVAVTVPVMEAGTIFDVGGQGVEVLQTGDTLSFAINGASFARNALTFGLPRNPTEFTFALISGPLSGAGPFSASLHSADGAVSVDFRGPLEFHDGSFYGAGYQGAVSTLQGYLTLPPLLSQELFGAGPVMLTLRNDGPEIILGLEPYSIRQDLFVSLSAGPMSVGAVIGSVQFTAAGRQEIERSFTSSQLPESLSPAPEPDSAGLFLTGGTLLCGLSMAMTRISRRRN